MNRDLRLWNDEELEAYARLVKQGAAMAIQLAHAGRKSECEGLI